MAGSAIPAGEVPGRVLDAVAPKFQPATEESHRSGGLIDQEQPVAAAQIGKPFAGDELPWWSPFAKRLAFGQLS